MHALCRVCASVLPILYVDSVRWLSRRFINQSYNRENQLDHRLAAVFAFVIILPVMRCTREDASYRTNSTGSV